MNKFILSFTAHTIYTVLETAVFFIVYIPFYLVHRFDIRKLGLIKKR